MRTKTFFFLSVCLFMQIAMQAQNADAQLDAISQQLSKGQAGVSALLSDGKYMHLHSNTRFRELIKQYAKQESITIVAREEPGIPLTVKAKMVSVDGHPAANMLVYVYQTDNSGSYGERGKSPQVGGNSRYARLFGYLRTANDGSFSFNTIHPQGYPDSGVPQHIHIEVYDNNDRQVLVSEFLFDEDQRLDKTMKQRMQSEGFVIASNKGSDEKHVYNYELRLKKD